MEDFSKLTNGGDTGLSRTDGETNGWNGRGLETWKIEESTAHKKKILRSVNGLAGWHPLGKPHDLNLNGVKSVTASMTVLQQKSHSTLLVWLADENQNGYGVEYMGFGQQLRIFKLQGNQLPFGQSRDVSAWVQLLGQDESGRNGKILEPIDDDALVNIRLKIEQDKAGGPVTLTAWSVVEVNGIASSAEDPLFKMVDDGSGAGFSNAQGKSTPTIDLGQLTFLAFSASNNKDGQPAFSSVGVELDGVPAQAKRR